MNSTLRTRILAGDSIYAAARAAGMSPSTARNQARLAGLRPTPDHPKRIEILAARRYGIHYREIARRLGVAQCTVRQAVARPTTAGDEARITAAMVALMIGALS